MIPIIAFFAYCWIAPIKIASGIPDSIYIWQSFITADNQGKVWFSWLEDPWPYPYYVVARYHENGVLSNPDTVMTGGLVAYLTGLTRDKNGNIWVLGDDDSEIWTSFYDGNQWSMPIPIFAAANFGSVSGADSLGNYWVAWCTDLYDYWTIHVCYYDGNQWSSRMLVSDHPYLDCISCGMATAGDGRIWLPWAGVGYVSYLVDSLFVSTYDGDKWSTGQPLAENTGTISPSVIITSSLTDNYVWVSYRHWDTGDIYVIRFSSFGSSPETVWTNSQFESFPFMTSDDTGKMWLFFCDSLSPGNYKLYYAIWGGDSITSPALVDTLNICDPRPKTTFDPVHRRIWVAYKSNRSGYIALYATYTDLEEINEENQNIPKPGFALFCSPNPTKNDALIKYVIPRRTKVKLSLYDNSGRLVENILDDEKSAGTYSEIIRSKDLPLGIYYLLLRTSDAVIKKKIIFIK